MSDLDKLIGKMQKEKKSVPKPVEKPSEDEEEKKKSKERQEEEIDEEDADEEDEEMEDEEDDEKEVREDETPSKTSKPIPATSKDNEMIEQEISLLQNEGIFRRELLMTLKELVDVHKINTQTLLDLKKAVVGDKNDKN